MIRRFLLAREIKRMVAVVAIGYPENVRYILQINSKLITQPGTLLLAADIRIDYERDVLKLEKMRDELKKFMFVTHNF